MVFFVIVVLFFREIFSTTQVATVYYESEKLKVVVGEYHCDTGVACGSFKDEIHTDGWDKLNITTNSQGGIISDLLQSEAIGLLEGVLCYRQIWSIYWNHLNHWGWVNKSIPTDVANFMTENLKWTREQASSQKTPLFKQVTNILAQFKGLVDGYNKVCEKGKDLTEMNMFYLQSAGDLYGVLNKYGMQLPYQGLDCSALIKMVKNDIDDTFSEVFVGHDTWRSFGIQNKVFKTFTLDMHSVVAKSIAFSSSPGFISSKDDYYLTSERLVIMETTNSVFNKQLASDVSPHSLFTWIRSPLASRMASSGEQWTDLFAQYSSATYTNQWMVIDMKKFYPNLRIENGFLMILEEIPLFTHTDDLTLFIKSSSYWPSYNIPFFSDIYNKSGYEEMRKKHGDDYSYTSCPRAKIFEELQPKITTMDDFAYAMQYNEYTIDPLSKLNPKYAIMARGDLDKDNPAPFGGIDGKITSHEFSKYPFKQKIHAGPTTENPQITPPFEWTEKYKDTVHDGQPDKYDFKWIDISIFE